MVNNKADWLIAREDRVRWESQTENDKMKKGGVIEVASQMENESDTHNGIEVKVTSFGAVQGLIEMD